MDTVSFQGKLLHSKQTGYNGDSLVIGAAPVFSIEEIKSQNQVSKPINPEYKNGAAKPQADPSYKCMKLSEKHRYKDTYGTMVMNRSTRSYQLTATETRSPVTFSEYFVYISKELFTCTEPENKLPQALKIVNQLMSVKEIFEIKYYDGVEVSSINHLGDDRRVKIIETKYVFTNSTGEYTMSYDGLSEETSDEIGVYHIPDFISEHTLYGKKITKERKWGTETTFGDFKEWSTLIDSPETIHISDSGNSLKLGYNRIKVRKLYEGAFTPECYQQIGRKTNGILYAEVGDRDFSKIFTFVKREVWLCTANAHEGNVKVESFLRVVTEMIGRTRVKTLAYENGLTSLYSISIPGGVSIRFSTLGYFEPNTRELGSGNVRLEFVEPGKIQSIIKWNPESLCVRAKNFDHEFPTIFMVKINEDDIMHKNQEIDEMDEPKYYRYIHREVHYCDYSIASFYRIVNMIEVLVPVREIETVDGVQLFQTLLDNNKKSVNIVETKYVEYSSRRQIMVKGIRMNFIKHRIHSMHPTFERRFNKFAISKSLDETIPRIGHSPNRISEDRDVDPNWDPKNFKKLSVGEGDDVITINVDLTTDTVNDKNDIADCELSNTNPINLLQQFRISNGGKFKADESLLSYYFEKVVSEVWICKVLGKDTFFRILTEQSLKKQVITKIAEIKFTDMDRVWIEIENDGFEVKMKGIRYVLNVANRPINYLGHLVFEEKPRSGKWQSGTQKFLNNVDNPIRELEYHEAEKELSYNLDRQKKYDCVLNKDGDNLEIGSKWERLFGTRDSIIHCQIHEKKEGVVDEKYRTKISWKKNNKNEVENHSNVLENYFENIKQEIWKCSDQHGNKVLRILNQLSVQKNSERNKKSDIGHIYYHDGVSILWGARPDSQIQIIEVKYLDPIDCAVLKFEGKVELTGYDAGNIGVTENLKLAKELVKHDLHYLLGENEIYKTVINSKGIILKVGEQSDDLSSSSFREMTCEKSKKVDQKDDKLIPKVAITMNSVEKEDFVSVALPNSTEINKYFEFSQEIWDCQIVGQQPCKRVVNKLKLRESIQVAQVYHFENVIVNHLDGDVQIEETKILMKCGRKIDFKGVVHLLSGEPIIEESHLHTLGKPFRDFLYFLDTETVYLANPSPIGRTVEIGTHWQKEFQNENNQVVRCERVIKKAYDNDFGTSVFADSFTAKQMNDIHCYLWVEIEKKSPHLFEEVDQDVWQCTIDGNLVFYRVINNLFISKKMTNIYYHDGVEVRSQVLPDKSTVIQITELKYIEPNTNKVLKYDGKVKMQANNVVDRLTQISPKVTEKYLVPLRESFAGDAFRGEASSETPYTLDALRIYSLKKATETSNGVIHGIVYSEKLTTIFTDSGYRRFKIGSHWNEVFTTNGGTMRCLLDEWNKPIHLRYMPIVMEYIDDKLYELDEDGLEEIFEIKKIELWICTNEHDTILRVVTVLSGKIPIFSIRHYDGVSVSIFELQPGIKSVEVIETVYIDPKTSKLLKYGGDLEQTRKTSEGDLTTIDSFSRQTSTFFRSITPKIRKAWYWLVRK
ncbi:hypothetical protein LSTR_LSTR001532 [Laodelphax striatellus]|uniref:Uncharacterized protein n=1 Tax=Laodelphax striatellus TaxID=195883 RepID=A0A482XD86_LAOST|nr:hypothetical protein LSTR_LSTR001532 [Laodelphax striatellus]